MLCGSACGRFAGRLRVACGGFAGQFFCSVRAVCRSACGRFAGQNRAACGRSAGQNRDDCRQFASRLAGGLLIRIGAAAGALRVGLRAVCGSFSDRCLTIADGLRVSFVFGDLMLLPQYLRQEQHPLPLRVHLSIIQHLLCWACAEMRWGSLT